MKNLHMQLFTITTVTVIVISLILGAANIRGARLYVEVPYIALVGLNASLLVLQLWVLRSQRKTLKMQQETLAASRGFADAVGFGIVIDHSRPAPTELHRLPESATVHEGPTS